MIAICASIVRNAKRSCVLKLARPLLRAALREGSMALAAVARATAAARKGAIPAKEQLMVEA